MYQTPLSCGRGAGGEVLLCNRRRCNRKGKATLISIEPNGLPYGAGAGVDSVGKQRKLEARKILEKPHRAPASSVRFVGQFFVWQTLWRCSSIRASWNISIILELLFVNIYRHDQRHEMSFLHKGDGIFVNPV